MSFHEVFPKSMKPIATSFGWPRSVPSAAVGMSEVCLALACPFLGRLIDRLGIKTVTLTSITLFCLATAALARAPANAAVFIAMFSLAGGFGSGQSPLPYAKAITEAFDRRRGLALALAMSGVGLGAALMRQLAQHYLAHLGWRGAFVALALTVFAIALPAVALFLRELIPFGILLVAAAAAILGLPRPYPYPSEARL